MSQNAEPVGGVGGIGGMNPAASVDFFRQASQTSVRGQTAYGQSGAAKEKDAAQQGGSFAEQFGDSVQLSPEAEQQLKELKQRDAEVRAHERAHMAAAGQHAVGGAQYTYQAGPDGRRYAIGGHVNIDTSSVPDDPEASEEKAQQVRRAALAPGDPSAQDMQVAAQAAQMEAEARVDAREEKKDGGETGAADGSLQTNVDPLTSSLAAGPNVGLAAQSGMAAASGNRANAAPEGIETERTSRRQAAQAYESASLGFPSAGEMSRAASPSGDGSSWRMTSDGLFAAYSSSGSQSQRAGGAESLWSGVSPQRATRAYSGMAGGAGYGVSASVSGSMFSFAV